jgi:hypothetical protein
MDKLCEHGPCEKAAVFYLQPKTSYNPSGEYCRKHTKRKKRVYSGQYEAVPLYNQNEEL